MDSTWSQIRITVNCIGNGVVVKVCAGKDYADTALPNMHFPDLKTGLDYAIDQATDPARIIASGSPDDEGPF